jgi:hypothetical protein
MVSDLLQLWRDGIKVPTESCPESTQLSPYTQEDILIKIGHLVRVILMAVVCNKPAAHKVGGFGSHSHTNFCTLCWISTHDKTKPAAFKRGGASLLSVCPTLTCYSLPSSDRRRAPSSWGRVLQVGISDRSQDLREGLCDAIHPACSPIVLQPRQSDCHQSDAQSVPW